MVVVNITEELFSKNISISSTVRLSEKVVEVLSAYAAGDGELKNTPETKELFQSDENQRDLDLIGLIQRQRSLNGDSFYLTSRGREVVSELKKNKMIACE